MLPDTSCECVVSSLDLFEKPQTQLSIEETQRIIYKPVSTLTDNQIIEFNIHASPEHYTDLSETYLYLKARIVNQDGSSMNEAQSRLVAPTNYWMHGMFSQVDLSLNNTTVCSAGNYGYRAYIEGLLNHDISAKAAQLSAALWQDDIDHDIQDTPQGSNRGDFTFESKPVDLMGRIHLDLCNQEKFLLNNINIKFRFVRAKDEFHLLRNGDFNPKVQIMEASLFVTRVKVAPNIQLAHARTLEVSNARYNYRKVDIKTFTIQGGSLSANIDAAFLGNLPNTLVLGFVDHDSFNGSFARNPYNFKHMDLSFLALYVNGKQIPTEPISPDFENNCFIESFFSLFTGTGRALSNEGFGITRNNYSKGFALHAFDLTVDEQGNRRDHLNITQQGSLKIELKFKKPLPRTINAIIYSDIDSCIQIDRHRNIILE